MLTCSFWPSLSLYRLKFLVLSSQFCIYALIGQKLLGCGSEKIIVCLKIPVSVATVVDSIVLTSCEKIASKILQFLKSMQLFVATETAQVSSKISKGVTQTAARCFCTLLACKTLLTFCFCIMFFLTLVFLLCLHLPPHLLLNLRYANNIQTDRESFLYIGWRWEICWCGVTYC